MSHGDTRRRRGRCLRGLSVVVAGLALAGSLVAPTPAMASDGAPELDGVGGLPFLPMSVPTTGGPIGIYGRGLLGVTSVTFGGTASPNFTVVDSNLILAQAPALPNNNAFVNVTVTDGQGTATNGNFFYTSAVITAFPSSGADTGYRTSLNMVGYSPNTSAAIAQASPMLQYVEPRPTGLPPTPYMDVLVASASTDAGGDLVNYGVSTTGGSNFNSDGDPKATCKTPQEQVDRGLPACLLAWSQYGRGIVYAPITYSGNLTPAPPTLNVAGTGLSRTVSGLNWGANPSFGSSTNPSKPGETLITVDVCYAAVCVPASSPAASVSLFRYKVVAADAGNGTVSGSTLDGSLTVPVNRAACNSPVGGCLVRVRQFKPGGGYLEATAPLT